MPRPGEYRPDPSEGITRIEDLPRPKVQRRSRNFKRRPCPRCGHSSSRDRQFTRTRLDLGNPLTRRPRDIRLTYSQHYGSRCRKYFNADLTDRADPGSHDTRRGVAAAARLVVEDGLPDQAARGTLWREHRACVPYATIQNWVEAGGEQGGATHRRRAPRRGAEGLLGVHRRGRVVRRPVRHPLDRR